MRTELQILRPVWVLCQSQVEVPEYELGYHASVRARVGIIVEQGHTEGWDGHVDPPAVHDRVVLEPSASLFLELDELLVVGVVPDSELEVFLTPVVKVDVQVQTSKQVGEDLLYEEDLDRLALNRVHLRNVNVFKVKAWRHELCVIDVGRVCQAFTLKSNVGRCNNRIEFVSGALAFARSVVARDASQFHRHESDQHFFTGLLTIPAFLVLDDCCYRDFIRLDSDLAKF